MSTKKLLKVYYCPCDCKTPKGMTKKFFKIHTLIEHITSLHDKSVDLKFMYRLRTAELNVNSGKKRSFEEYEDGFKEIQSVDEEKDDEDLENEIDIIEKSFTKKSSFKDDDDNDN